jgi:TonB family protein
MSVKESVDTLLAAVKADMRVPEPMAPAAPLPEAPTMAELPDTLAVLPNTTQPPEAVERLQDTVKEALKDLAVPSPLEQITPVPPSRKLSEPPENQASISTHAPMALARTKEQLQAVVTKALEKVELPEPAADSGPLEVAAVYPSTLPAPSVHSELKVIRERNQVLAEEHVAERQATANAQSSGPLPTMQQDAQWEKAFAEYASRVKMVIDRNWHWQGNNDLALSVSVSFRIYPDGRATRVAISDTSGNEIFDRAAIRAVRQLKKLPRFPADIQKKFLDVVMAFSKVRAS